MSIDHSPWLSVIVPIYNAEKHLEKCVKSVLKQSFTDFELLLVNDGSTDNSANLCEEFTRADSRVVYLKKENGGPFQARIYGVEHTHGEYVTFCDADDYYARKDAFEKIKKYVEQYKPDVLQFDFCIKYNHLSKKHKSVNETTVIGKEEFLQNEYPLFLCSFYDGAHFTHNVWNKVYRRSLLASLPSSDASERLFWGDDLVTNLICLENSSSAVIVPDVLYVYKDTTGGTTRFSKNTMRDLDIIKRYQLNFLNKSKTDNKEKIFSTIHTETAYWFGAWIKDGNALLNTEELKTIIEKALTLSSITEAREFFMKENSLDWEVIELLRKGDATQYIEWANENQATRKRVIERIKRIYKTL